MMLDQRQRPDGTARHGAALLVVFVCVLVSLPSLPKLVHRHPQLDRSSLVSLDDDEEREPLAPRVEVEAEERDDPPERDRASS